ncbi:hypothetical protein [Faecalibacillus intestinalis]|jgi:hypothetical protein|uniref:hypothetical protein n=2 Tax=Bacteria TaxID=2 RepID=UPI002E76FCA5|nr:hypothetical protein [Faecalibacillus intestinalis]MEE0280276.1 hypothetical protein [Faecalibacillus intestinalis]
MIDWKKINSKIFEDLAYDYISDQYDDLQWEKTKATRDGNRDGESSYIAPFNTTIKYWYEAKYSTDVKKSIPKSHLDSTLVSCMLDGKVAALAFITNAYISEDYRRRADTFSRHSDNLKIIYVNGEELENWLYDNPEIELKYFYEKHATQNTTEEGIKNTCVLQSYDYCGNNFSKTNTLELGREYVIYISFYSHSIQKGLIYDFSKSIELIPNDDRPYYDNYKSFNIVKGYNSFYFPFKAKNILNQNIEFKIKCNLKFYQVVVNNIKILDIYNPTIQYASQIETGINIYNLINDKDAFNGVFLINGAAGSGKSYLLNNIFNSTKNPFNSFVIRFTGDNEQDAINCFKMIIVSLYGDVWRYIKIDSNFIGFNDLETMMIQQIVENRISPGIVNQISLFYKNNKKNIESKISPKHIFVDDLHKLSYNNKDMIYSFLGWFSKQKFNCKIYLFSRPQNTYFDFVTKTYEINNITINDVSTTMKLNFDNSLLINLIKNYPAPFNVLHFLNILNKIHEYENVLNKYTELELQMLLNEIYSVTSNNTSISLGRQIVEKYKKDCIVYCIYKIETGISYEAISNFFNEQDVSNIYYLCKNRIIKESSNRFYPYHDILKTAYEVFNSQEMDKILEQFVVFSAKEKYITKSTMFTVLINIGKTCFWKHKSKAEAYRDYLHKNADYLQALQVAKALKENNKKSYSDYNEEDCKNQFIYANCIKYTRSYRDSNDEFEKISELYKVSNNLIIQSISLEAKTEIINNDIWMLELEQAKTLLNEIEPVLDELYKSEKIEGRSLTYAFLNYYNRRMFVNYMLDIGKEEDYNIALSYSKKLNKKEYIAFAKMDYAKSLYCSNLPKALSLLKESLNILECMSTEKRRMLDARSEIWFINCLNKQEIAYKEYFKIKDDIVKNNYIQSFVKIQLKMILLELLFSNKSANSLRDNLELISINNSSIKTGKRHQAYIYHLYAATYYIEKDLYNSKLYSKRCLNFFKQMGLSYKELHESNIQLNKYNGLTIINKSGLKMKNQFIIDIRLW